MIKTVCALLPFVFFYQLSLAQEVWKEEVLLQIGKNTIETKGFTAYTIQYAKEFGDSMLQSDQGGWYTEDKHVDAAYLQTHLKVETGQRLMLYSKVEMKATVLFQNVPEVSQNSKIDRRSFDCDMPGMIVPEEWRAGLNPPKPNPSRTFLQHAIVHHSASGNGNTDYTGLVRNYYVQHTQVNGWDDIGYNYLIAQDGSIFIGRDKQNLLVSNYEVQGAHFCAKNKNTAGICMIGDFTSSAPSDTSLGSLQRLVTYMFYEEQIEATDSSRHPNSTGNFLDHISGHLDGCATVCPGDSVYIRLTSVRKTVEQQRQSCIRWVETEKVSPVEPFYDLRFNRLTNHSNNNILILSTGGKALKKLKPKESILVNDFSLGIYILMGANMRTEKIFIGN